MNKDAKKLWEYFNWLEDLLAVSQTMISENLTDRQLFELQDQHRHLASVALRKAFGVEGPDGIFKGLGRLDPEEVVVLAYWCGAIRKSPADFEIAFNSAQRRGGKPEGLIEEALGEFVRTSRLDFARVHPRLRLV